VIYCEDDIFIFQPSSLHQQNVLTMALKRDCIKKSIDTLQGFSLVEINESEDQMRAVVPK
jgi:hypothetical protein